jgi:hypothetical protein
MSGKTTAENVDVGGLSCDADGALFFKACGFL